MGNKIVQVGLIVGGVIVIILFITAIMGVFTSLVSTANTTIAASSNWSNYPGSQAFLLGAPLWIYFIPVVVGGVWIGMILQSKKVR